ncbi:MAG: hypothetical protein M4579_000294 [Chaenotheca gracillima]|nr:MAG: hypothetical protein M4579_000294 [Chaenotheca gracillima]
MYWPLGAPRIYAVEKGEHHEVDNSGLDKGSSSTSPDRQEAWPPREDSVAINDDLEGSEATQTGRLLEEESQNASDGPVAPRSNEQYGDRAGAIIGLRIARSGYLFGTITRDSLTIWQTRPTAVLSVVVRSSHSIHQYGENVSFLLRPDSGVLVVQTSKGYLITYSLSSHPTSRVYKPNFIGSSSGHARRQSTSSARAHLGDGRVLWDPTEGGGIRSVHVRFRTVIKIDAGIRKALALDDELVVATERPQAVQCIRWTPDSSGNQTQTERLSHMDWMSKKSSIREMVHDRAMHLSAWITSDGRTYAVQRQVPANATSGNPKALFQGYCFHDPSSEDQFALKTAINARFSMLAVGCANGCILVYNARDYVGNIPLSHKLKLDISSSSSGSITLLTYSADGYCLFAGFENGWATWSVFGKPLASSFSSDRKIAEDHRESWLTGIHDGAWMPTGSDILLVSPFDERIWILEMARSAVTTCYSSPSLSRALLQTNSGFMLYKGFDSSDFNMLSSESALWHTVDIPSSYLVDQGPIRCLVTSPDGRYVAVAGRHGLAHYSVNSGRWKPILSDNMENEFVVRGGMCWYRHILIAAVEFGERYEIRLFSRELALENSTVLHVEVLDAPAVLISLSGDDSLLVYTYDNVLSHYVINFTTEGVALVQVGQIGFHGIVRAPARVRAMSWVLPDEQLQDGDPSQDVAVASVLFLVDGRLVLLQPSMTSEGDLKYDMRVMMQNVEFFTLTRDIPPVGPSDMSGAHGDMPGKVNNPGLGDSLWVFDGTQMRVWTDIQEVLRSMSTEVGKDIPTPAMVNTDFYPLSVSLEKAVVLGVESELIQRRDSTFAFFKLTTRTHLFLPYILHYYLAQTDSPAALHLCHRYRHLQYFAHALEILLHDVLDAAVDGDLPEQSNLLPSVTSFLSSFPEFLDIVVQCTRKTEVRSWKTLFSCLPPPQDLFEESLQKNLLKTAGGYLLILHTLDELGSNSGHIAQLLLRAKEAEDWELCKELARFLMALDDSGAILRDALSVADLGAPSEWRRTPVDFQNSQSTPPVLSGVRLPLRSRPSEEDDQISKKGSTKGIERPNRTDVSAQDYFSSGR